MCFHGIRILVYLHSTTREAPARNFCFFSFYYSFGFFFLSSTTAKLHFIYYSLRVWFPRNYFCSFVCFCLCFCVCFFFASQDHAVLILDSVHVGLFLLGLNDGKDLAAIHLIMPCFIIKSRISTFISNRNEIWESVIYKLTTSDLNSGMYAYVRAMKYKNIVFIS